MGRVGEPIGFRSLLDCYEFTLIVPMMRKNSIQKSREALKTISSGANIYLSRADMIQKEGKVSTEKISEWKKSSVNEVNLLDHKC